VNEKDLWTGIFTAAIPAGNRRSRFGSKGEEQSDPVSRVCMQGPCGVHVVLVCIILCGQKILKSSLDPLTFIYTQISFQWGGNCVKHKLYEEVMSPSI
jgi:hypothetical protein